MIAQLKGTIISKAPTELIIDCAGVGYLVFTSINSSSKLAGEGELASVYTVLIPREDSWNLFGFADTEERDVFKLLISVSGIGPKTAIGMLSFLTVSDFQQYLLSGNLNALQKLPGIGKKTAERLVLELKDKITKINIQSVPDISGLSNLVKQEAVSALVSLGFSNAISEKAVKNAIDVLKGTQISAEKLIRTALKIASNG